MRPTHIVGIGGSAGGLQAFKELLIHLPADTGMAFVFVMHMGNESWMFDILSNLTPMEAIRVEKQTRIKANHIYVNIPHTNLVLKNGCLNSVPSRKTWGCPVVIDHFFNCLAADAGKRAIGIVMSGLLWDGSKGVQSIRAAHGITFAQSVKSAAHASMPNAAIETGSVDFTGTPKEIAIKLIEIAGLTENAPQSLSASA